MTSINTNLDTDFFLKGTVDAFIKPQVAEQETPVKAREAASEPEQDTQFEENLQDKKDKLANSREKDPVKTFKKKLETVNEVLDYLMQIAASQNPQEQNLDLKDLKFENLLEITVTVDLKENLKQRVEDLIKDIAVTDLSKADGIQNILEMSNQVEALTALESKLDELLKQFDLNEVNQDQAELDPEIKVLMESKIDNYVEMMTNKEVSSKETSSENIELSLGDLDKELLEQMTIEHAENDSARDQGSSSFDDNKFFMDFKAGFVTGSASDSAAKIQHEVVNINKLDTFIQERVQKLPVQAKESISLTLTPDNFGQVKLSIVKTGLKLEIEIQLSNDEGLESTQSKLNDLHAVLKEKGYDTEIKVTVDNTSNMNQDSTKQGSYYNEARDEQKDKYLNTSPAWLKTGESHQEASFEAALGGILN